MIIKNVDLETVCGITSKIPENQMPEIAFAGKSNVGEIITDQYPDEPEILCPYFWETGEDPDH